MLILIFIELFLISLLTVKLFKKHQYSPTASGSIVMSLGIFCLYALTALPLVTPLIIDLITLEALSIWLIVAGSFVKSAVHGKFVNIHLKDLMNRFAIGTWVAGSAVLAVLIDRQFEAMNWLIYFLAAVALIVYVPYALSFIRGYIDLWRKPLKQESTGVILLATVATQSVIIMLHSLFNDWFSIESAAGLVVFDSLFLGSGLVLVLFRYRNLSKKMLAHNWYNVNCIIHGAVSITGLALLVATGLSHLAVIIWLVAASLFIVVELIEVLRAVVRIKQVGWQKGIFVYDVTQWSRNFTFGMFLAFSMALLASVDNGGIFGLLLESVVSMGKYIVLILVLTEAGLFLRSRVSADDREDNIVMLN